MTTFRRLGRHKRYTNIVPTKTYTYYFEPLITIYHEDKVYDAFFAFPQSLKIINVFLEDTGLDKHKLDDHVVHVICEVPDSSMTKKYLSNLMQSKFFRGCYVLDADPLVVVIIFQPMFRNSYDSFLTSQYSQMIKPNILKAPEIRKIFCNREDEPYMIYKILTNDESLKAYWKKIISPDGEDIEQAASRIYVEDEIIDIREYYESIKCNLGEHVKLRDM